MIVGYFYHAGMDIGATACVHAFGHSFNVEFHPLAVSIGAECSRTRYGTDVTIGLVLFSITICEPPEAV